MRNRLIVLLIAMGLALPVYAEEAKEAAEPTPEAKLNDLAVEYTLRYQFSGPAKAIPVAEQALAFAEQAFGPEHERVAQVLNDLGHLYQAQGDAAKALGFHERALKIREQLFAGDGPSVVQSLVNLAKAYAAQHRDADAQPLFKRALTIAERHVQPTDPFLLGILGPYADSLRRSGKREAAEAVEARIAGIKTTESGAEKTPSISEVLQ